MMFAVIAALYATLAIAAETVSVEAQKRAQPAQTQPAAAERQAQAAAAQVAVVTPPATTDIVADVATPVAAAAAPARASSPRVATTRNRRAAGRIQLDETVISGNQELPKVLYILPWREPEGLPQIEMSAEFTELEVFRRLYPPAYRRELEYFDMAEGSDNEE